MISFVVPAKTINPLNGSQGRTRGAMIAEAKRRKVQRNVATLCTLANLRVRDHQSGMRITVASVTMTRLSAGRLDDDNLRAACKSVRDGIADALGLNDGDPGVRWVYEQEKCKRGLYGVRVAIT